MLLPSVIENKFLHLNSIAHEGKVVVFGTTLMARQNDTGQIWYTVRQDGFEDSYLNKPADQRTGWEDWKLLQFPDEKEDDPSVVERETNELTDKEKGNFILRSVYRSKDRTAIAPVQLVSALGHIYVFRQSKENTLLVDRFVLDGLTNELVRKLDVRFKRSRQKYVPYQKTDSKKKGARTTLTQVDTLDFQDADGRPFYEPTTELCLIKNLVNGWFSVVLVPTNEHEHYRWHIFAYNNNTKQVEIISMRSSEEGLFDVRDGAAPLGTSGIIRRTLELTNKDSVKPVNGLAATKYDVQKEVMVKGESQFVKEATRILLAIPTDDGNTAALSFGLAGNGTLAQIEKNADDFYIWRDDKREIMLPLNTLDEIKAIGDSKPAAAGIISKLESGVDDRVIISSDQVKDLQWNNTVEIKETTDYNGHYTVEKFDDRTFTIVPKQGDFKSLGQWKKLEEETSGLVFDGLITAYESIDGRLRVTCENHGLGSNDEVEVQIVGTTDYNAVYRVGDVTGNKFTIERKWQPGEAVNVIRKAKKRRGIQFDGAADFIEIPDAPELSLEFFTLEAWINPDETQADWSNIIGKLSVDRRQYNYWICLVSNKASSELRFQIRMMVTSGGAIAIDSTSYLAPNAWSHIAAAWDGAKLSLYLNGKLDRSQDVNLDADEHIVKNLESLLIGGEPFNQAFAGKIADVRVWNQARTEKEIKDSMYLQLTGMETGLVGYWRLGAIAEGPERKVVDFSVSGFDGVVHGNPFVSEVSLKRTLGDDTTRASQYSNDELFAVSQGATYEESFEFRLTGSAENPTPPLFKFSYWGKKNRNSEKRIPEDPKQENPFSIEQKFGEPVNGWYTASCRFTVPEEVSLVRLFEISLPDDDPGGDWESIEIRKHRIRSVSNSITEAKYKDKVKLETLADSQATSATKLKELESKESREAALLIEKQKLEREIALLNNEGELEAQVAKQKTNVTYLSSQVQNRKSAYDTADSPFNYSCKIIEKKGIYNYDGHYIQVNTTSPFRYKLSRSSDDMWEFIHQSENVYKIKHVGSNSYLHANPHGGEGNIIASLDPDNNFELIRSEGDNYQFKKAGGAYAGLYLWSDVNGYLHVAGQPKHWDVWGLEKVIPNAYLQTLLDNWNTKKTEYETANKELQRLKHLLGNIQNNLEVLQKRLDDVIGELNQVQADLASLNTKFINEVIKIQQKPQTMVMVKTDSNGLVTQGALLGFVQSASRLNAIETCEGNVQLSYFDIQGRMRQTNYDATADSKNAAFEQWLPDAQRVCLNFNQSSSIVKLEYPIILKDDWTIEAWFSHPLPAAGEWNTLTGGKSGGQHIRVRNRKQLGVYLENDPLGQNFYESGFDMETLSTGWHHLTAVGRGDTTLFYIDGENVGNTKETALADARKNLEKTPNDLIKKKVEDLKEASLKVVSNVYAIGNNHLAIDKPAENAVMQFDGANDYVEVPYSSAMDPGTFGTFTVSLWAKVSGGKDNRSPLTSRDADPLRGYMLYVTPEDKWHFSVSNLISWKGITGPGITINEWTHVTGTYDGSTLKLYINGKEAGTLRHSFMNYSPNTARPLRIGAGATELNPPQFFFKGQIAEVCIWNKDRTGRDIQADMKKRLSGQEPNLVAYYPMNEIKVEGTSRKTLNLVGNNHGTVVEATVVNDPTLPLAPLVRGEHFGKLAEVRIWGVALTPEEIAVNSKTLLTGNEPGLLAYYPMNEASGETVRDITGTGHEGTGTGLKWWGCAAPIGNLGPIGGGDAVVSAEYSTIGRDPETGQKSSMMRRFLAAPTSRGILVLPEKRIEMLDLKWIGNGQFAPTLLGYIEGAPPAPSENLTEEDDYNGATSVELSISDDVTLSWNRAQDVGWGESAELFSGADEEAEAGLGVLKKIFSSRAGVKGNAEFSFQKQHESNITAGSSINKTDRLELRGTPETDPKFPHLGNRFIPKNVGYALVVSALADVFVTRLQKTRRMVSQLVLPVENIPPDVNTITFLINPSYTMSGSLDGMTGSSATSNRFFKHVPEMRAQYGALYPASYYRLQEAYDLKQQITLQDKNRESYFAQFNAAVMGQFGGSVNDEIYRGDAPQDVSVTREEDKPATPLTAEEQKKAEAAAGEKSKAEVGASSAKQKEALKEKRAEIDTLIADQGKKQHAMGSLENWQRKMQDIIIRAGKRNLVNTYVWDADGGLRTEAQSFANMVEHTIGGAFTSNAGLGGEGNFVLMGVAVELTAQATTNLTQTMSKTESRSTGIGLNVDVSGVESKGITDHNDYPLLPGEKVDRYRFMSFYLESSTKNFNDFFNYVVDPEWLASNDEEARALRQAQGKANKTWRILHRVTYVERPALMGFGRDIRSLTKEEEMPDNKQLQAQIEELKKNNIDLATKIDKILDLLDRA